MVRTVSCDRQRDQQTQPVHSAHSTYLCLPMTAACTARRPGPSRDGGSENAIRARARARVRMRTIRSRVYISIEYLY